MAKGRRLTSSRSERYLLGSYGYRDGHSMPATDAPELGEEDVWSIVDGGGGGGVASSNGNRVNNSHGAWSPRAGSESNRSNGSFSHRSQRSIPPRERRHVGGLSLAFEDSIPSSDKTAPSRILLQFRGQQDGVVPASPRQVATSAPVNVPDWSKVYRVDSVESLHDSDDGFDDRDGEMVPPHEYLAREYARSKKMGGASVFEGVGRTLKGLDMSRVRDAVWSQTGFDG